MPRTTITIATPSGQELTAEPEAWLGAILVSLPPELRQKVFENVQKHLELPLVGGPSPHAPGPRPSSRPPLLISPPLGLTVRKT